MSTNQVFDIAAALIIVVFSIIGFLRGFISAVMSFIGLFCGTYFAWKFSKEGTYLFLKFFPNVDESLANIAAMAIIFLCITMAISLISMIISSFIRFARLSGVNKAAGMLIGSASGFAIIVAVYGAITLFAPEIGQDWIKLSIFMNLAEKIWPHIYNYIMSNGFFGLLNSAKHVLITVFTV